jgi:hypothetical protein
MDDIFGMQILEAFNYLIDEGIDKFWVQALLILFDEVEKVALEVFED